MSRNANSRVIIDLDAYRANLAFIRKVVGNTVRMIPIVKANAYGHGLRAIAEAARYVTGAPARFRRRH